MTCSSQAPSHADLTQIEPSTVDTHLHPLLCRLIFCLVSVVIVLFASHLYHH